jgi:uncharacterized protein (TIGR03437 family)
MSLRSIVLLGSMASFSSLFAQSGLYCVGSAVPPVVHATGVSERLGDIVLTCTGGQPNATITGNLSVYLDVSVTNRTAGDGAVNVFLSSGINGSTNIPANVPARLSTASSVSWNGVSFQLSPEGAAGIRIANLRGNASEKRQSAGPLITAYLAFNGSIALNTNVVTVGRIEPGLLVTQQAQIVCAPEGSPLPEEISIQNLLKANSTFSSIRITEGFATAFATPSDAASLGADTGTRIIIRYTGLTPGARLFVPDAIAGVNADQPTSAGDMGFPASGGAYTPGSRQLLLIRVRGANAGGAGGSLVMPPPGAPASFNSAGEIPVNDGAAYAVYEVVDSDPSVQESAQVPTFLGLAPSRGGASVVTGQSANLAPVSDVITASPAAPIPRFIEAEPGSDCPAVNDCSAGYFPRMTVFAPERLEMTAVAGSRTTKYIQVRNAGSGVLRWSASATYAGASNWLTFWPASGVNNGTIRIDASAAGLAPGIYEATVTINGGALAGSRTVPVRFQVNEAQPVPVAPVITQIGNAADASIAVVTPGSIASIFGGNLKGQVVSVTFDGAPAEVLYSDAKQINLVVPAALAGKSTANLVVSVDGNASAPKAVNVSAASPAIFPGAVLNQDYSVNSETNPAPSGSVVQVFATGLPASGVITAKIHDRVVAAPYYAGAAPGLPGVQQVNIVVPEFPAMQTFVYVCGGAPDATQVCSPAAKIWVTP